jgi:hypothetical protein
MASEVLDDAAQPIVPPRTSGGPQAKAPQREVHVIHDHEHLIGTETKPIESGTHGTATVVHEGLGHQQTNALWPHPQLRNEAMQLALVAEGLVPGGRKPFEHQETDVVACIGVAGSWIP